MRHIERTGDLHDRPTLALEREAGRACRHLQVGNLRQHVQQRLGKTIGKVVVAIVAGHVDERQNRNGCRASTIDASRADRTARTEHGDRHDQHGDGNDGQVIESLQPTARTLVVRNLGLPLDALVREFVDPREYRNRNKTQCKQQDNHPRRPVGGAELGQDSGQHLGQQPADDEVRKEHPQYVPALEFFDNGHLVRLHPQGDRLDAATRRLGLLGETGSGGGSSVRINREGWALRVREGLTPRSALERDGR